MDYFITPEEIYMSLMVEEYNTKAIEKGTYVRVLDKIKNDSRIMEYSEGYYICMEKDKEAIENEYGFKLIPVHPDDFVMD